MNLVEGYWATHNYSRHSVGEIEEFCGWGKLTQICDAGVNQRNKSLPAFLFETGTRISEGLQLRLSHFDLSDPEFVRCVKVPIVKQKKIGTPERTFSFPKSEPLYPYIEAYLKYIRSITRQNKDPLLFPISRVQAWRIITEQGKRAKVDIWNHWFRSQRASQMGYEYDLTEAELTEWFKVIDKTWGRRYCKRGDFGLRKIMSERKPEQWRQ